MEKINVVVSGFDPYEGVEVNPSFEVPRILAERGMIDAKTLQDEELDGVEISITAVTMPVSFEEAWPQLLATINESNPDIIIATRLRKDARSIMLERCATNIIDLDHGEGDNSRRVKIDENGPAAYWTKLPLGSIIHAFAEDNIPANLSSDAGIYVCNSLFYNLLNWASKKDHVIAGFVGLPKIVENTGMYRALSLEQQVQAVSDVIRESVKYYLHPSSSDILLE
ncbi:MAG: pyroglutamyl-peptidase I [Bifidobacteriaceae bacterium]|nr:pyroglutamyl-peptidase I [Bifidobacteriaceae bacterium]